MRSPNAAKPSDAVANEPPRAPAPAASGSLEALGAVGSLHQLSDARRLWIVICVFLGWFFAGTQLSITTLVVRPASIDLLAADGRIDRELVRQSPAAVAAANRSTFEAHSRTVALWVTWQTCAFLFGAAAGGLVFGWVGDRFGRAKGMSASILCYSALTLAGYFAISPEQLLIMRFLASLGVGGMWPNGVSLAAEAWSSVSRPLLSGIIGTAANVAIALVSLLGIYVQISPDEWRWMMLCFGSPIVLGIITWLTVPESPRWLSEQETRRAARGATGAARATEAGLGDVFRGSVLRITLIGIVLGTVPIFGGWGCSNWAAHWADKVGAIADPYLKAQVLLARSFPGMISSFLGGWMASLFGRKRSYAACSVAALITAQLMFWFYSPADKVIFLWLTGVLGFFSGLFFGWLPLCLPELFPTRVRSTGAGVSFNFGRVVTAFGVLATSVLFAISGEDYPVIGRVTGLIYLLGAIVIWFAPLKESDELPD